PALLDPRLLASQIAQVVELGAANRAARGHLELRDRRRMNGEGPLHADPERDLADREGFAKSSALAPDHDTLEHLHALAGSLDDTNVNLDGVTGAELRHIRTKERLLDEVGLIHGSGERVYQRG